MVLAFDDPIDDLGGQTLADLFAYLDAHPERRAELIDGEIVAMAGATIGHDLIAGNIFAALHGPMRARGCQVHKSDVLVRRADHDRFGALPDVFVRCGPPTPTARAIDDAAVIFEVLSRSTEAFDRGRKFIAYEAMPSVRAYVLVRQDEQRVELWLRGPDGRLAPEAPLTGPAAVLRLDVIDHALPLAVIYDGIEWAA
jgi:Uma2 family endonuclease